MLLSARWFIGSSSQNQKLPFFLHYAGRAGAAQKTLGGPDKGCNITWGYVACPTDGGDGGVGFKSKCRGVALRMAGKC